MKLIYIEWFDHWSFTTNTWRTKDEYNEVDIPLCQTVGWLLKEDSKSYTVVSTIQEHVEMEDQYLGDMTILKGTVKVMKELKL